MDSERKRKLQLCEILMNNRFLTTCIIKIVSIWFCFTDVTAQANDIFKRALPETLSVVFVEFADVRSDSFFVDSTGQWLPFNYLHRLQDFERLLADSKPVPELNCDGDSVYGSFVECIELLRLEDVALVG